VYGPEKAYDPQTNPAVRCDLGSYFVDELGERAPPILGPHRAGARPGFVAPPFDNVGVQYGLGALQAGTITPGQFIDLNQKVGGAPIDYDPSPDAPTRPRATGPSRTRAGCTTKATNAPADHRPARHDVRKSPRLPLVRDARAARTAATAITTTR